MREGEVGRGRRRGRWGRVEGGDEGGEDGGGWRRDEGGEGGGSVEGRAGEDGRRVEEEEAINAVLWTVSSIIHCEE